MTHILSQNFINGEFVISADERFLKKLDPNTGAVLSHFIDSGKKEVDLAVTAAVKASELWSLESPIKRGLLLKKLVVEMELKQSLLSKIVASEGGKPLADAAGEVAGALLQGDFWAGEGMRLYGKTMASGNPEKLSFTLRKPHGVVGLIVPANTPIANIAWKIFPALVCGNCIVLKASELAPQVAFEIAKCIEKVGFPPGVFNLIQGGREAGVALVEHPDVSLISFTGSTRAGQEIAKITGPLLKRVSLELGGKNCLVVLEDADLEQAVKWSVLSAFSNAGQRCAAASRILICDSIYDEFKKKLIDTTRSLKLGTEPGCHLGPLITEAQRKTALNLLEEGIKDGGVVLEGEFNSERIKPRDGFYFLPTIVEGVHEASLLQTEEAFAPIVCLTKISDLDAAIRIINSSKYGLTCALHTMNVGKSVYFARRVKVGTVNINTGTYGSEPHMPFGGFRMSGNGTREPGSEALDVYSELTNVSLIEGK